MWPNHYPDGCPPNTAISPETVIFRFTNRRNPAPRDFKSYYESQPHHDWKNMQCLARGLSVYVTLEDSLAAAQKVPALKKKFIASGEVPRDSGVIDSTPSRNTQNHHTFWSLLNELELHPLFSYCEQP